jgi:hypothetical protein
MPTGRAVPVGNPVTLRSRELLPFDVDVVVVDSVAGTTVNPTSGLTSASGAANSATAAARSSA